MSGTYRDPQPPPPEPPDPEAAALDELAARARSLRRAVVLPSIALSIACGVALYFALRAWFFEEAGAHVPYVTGLLTIGPCAVIGWWLARALSRRALAARAPAWATELARRHSVKRETLIDLARTMVG